MNDYLKIMEDYKPVNALPDFVVPPAEDMKIFMVGYLHFILAGQSQRNVRKGPSTTYGLVSTLNSFEKIYYYPNTKMGDWVFITNATETVTGWLSFDPTILLFLQLPILSNTPNTGTTPIILQMQLQLDVADNTLGDLLKQNVVISYEKLS